MKKLLNIFWSKLKTQPNVWFFYVFLLFLTLSLRKILFYFPIQRAFNEYTSLYIHISDILLLGTISLWYLTILSHIKIKLSRNKLGIIQFIHNLSLFLPFLLVVWSFISLFWSSNKTITLFRSLKLLEFYGLYLYIVLRFVPLLVKTSHKKSTKIKTQPLSNVPRGTFSTKEKVDFKKSLSYKYFGQIFILIIILIGFLQSIVAIIQFIIQKSVGLFFLKESIISPYLSGIAKIVINNQYFIRSYGLMPHPNILGGFLLFSIIITLLYWKLFHVEQFQTFTDQKKELQYRRINQQYSNFSRTSKKLKQNTKATQNLLSNVPRGTFDTIKTSIFILLNQLKKYFYSHIWLIKGILLIQIIALILSFSKSAILGLCLALVFIYYTTVLKSKKMFHVEHFRIILLSSIIFLTSFLLFFQFNFHTDFIKSLQERLFYLNVSRETIKTHPLIGVGSGQFVLNLSFFSQKQPLIWQYQPVHNVFLLIWSELGFIGLFLFVFWLWKLFHVEQFQTFTDQKKEPQYRRIDQQHTNFSKTSKKLRQNTKITQNLLSNVPRGTFDTIKEYIKNILQLEIIKNIYNFKTNSTSASFYKNTFLNKKTVGNNYSILYNNIHYLSIRYLQGILLGYIFIMFFDHYLWDIQQGNLLFWLVTGLITGLQNIKN